MSKPIARITLFILVSLVLIAATSFSVRGWLDSTSAPETVGVQSHNVGGLQTNLNHDRLTVSEVDSLQAQTQPDSYKGGCNSESQNSTNDY